MKQYNKEYLISIIKEFAKYCQKSLINPSYDNYEFWAKENKKPSIYIYQNRFGTFGKVFDEAGIDKSVSQKGYTKQDCLDSIKQFYKEENSVKCKEYKEWHEKRSETTPSHVTICTKLGTWTSAVEQAGFIPLNVRFSKDSCIKILQQFYKETGKTNIREYNKWVREKPFMKCIQLPSFNQIADCFERSWIKAFKMIGIKKSWHTGRPKKITKEKAIKAFENFYKETGKTTTEEYNKWVKGKGEPCSASISSLWGNWNAFLESQGFEVNRLVKKTLKKNSKNWLSEFREKLLLILFSYGINYENKDSTERWFRKVLFNNKMNWKYIDKLNERNNEKFWSMAAMYADPKRGFVKSDIYQKRLQEIRKEILKEKQELIKNIKKIDLENTDLENFGDYQLRKSYTLLKGKNWKGSR